MNLESLRLLLDVANRLSFAAVADDHGMNPSSVSRAISQLEQQLGVRLFQRTTRTMSLTEAGERYVGRVAGLVEELDQAGEQARGLSGEPGGTLRLTASVAFGERVLVPVLPAFRERYPAISLELIFTDANVDLVAQGIDLAVRLAPALTGNVVATRLFRTAYRVVASPDYLRMHPPIEHPDDLQRHRCTLFALPAYRMAWSFRMHSAVGDGDCEVAVAGDVVVSSALSQRSVVLGGGGPALLADWLVDDDIAGGRLVDVLPDWQGTATSFDTAAWLLYPSRTYLPQKVRVAIDFLKARLAN